MAKEVILNLIQDDFFYHIVVRVSASKTKSCSLRFEIKVLNLSWCVTIFLTYSQHQPRRLVNN